MSSVGLRFASAMASASDRAYSPMPRGPDTGTKSTRPPDPSFRGVFVTGRETADFMRAGQPVRASRRRLARAEAVLSNALVQRDQAQLLQARFDRADRAPVPLRDVGDAFTRVEGLDQRVLLLLAPRTTDVLWQLGSTRGARCELFERADPGQECTQHIRLLQNRAGRQ